jgi:hypothetical protein
MLGLLLAARYDDGQAMTEAEVRDELKTLLISGPLAGLAWAPPIRLSRLLSAL